MTLADRIVDRLQHLFGVVSGELGHVDDSLTEPSARGAEEQPRLCDLAVRDLLDGQAVQNGL